MLVLLTVIWFLSPQPQTTHPGLYSEKVGLRLPYLTIGGTPELNAKPTAGLQFLSIRKPESSLPNSLVLLSLRQL